MCGGHKLSWLMPGVDAIKAAADDLSLLTVEVRMQKMCTLSDCSSKVIV